MRPHLPSARPPKIALPGRRLHRIFLNISQASRRDTRIDGWCMTVACELALFLNAAPPKKNCIRCSNQQSAPALLMKKLSFHEHPHGTRGTATSDHFSRCHSLAVILSLTEHLSCETCREVQTSSSIRQLSNPYPLRGRPIFAKKRKRVVWGRGGGGLAKFVSWKDIGARLAKNAQHFRQASTRCTFVRFQCAALSSSFDAQHFRQVSMHLRGPQCTPSQLCPQRERVSCKQ